MDYFKFLKAKSNAINLNNNCLHEIDELKLAPKTKIGLRLSKLYHELEKQIKYCIEFDMPINIVYLRVSSKKGDKDNKKQNRYNQFEDIHKKFNIDLNNFILVDEDESGRKEEKQDTRLFSLIIRLLKDDKYSENTFNLFVNHPDRIYRNYDRSKEFDLIRRDINIKIHSVNGEIKEVKDKTDVNDKLVTDVMNSFTYANAEIYAKNISDKTLSSQSIRYNKTFSKKGKYWGKPYKTIKGKKIQNLKEILQIQILVLKLIQKGFKYVEIVSLMSGDSIKPGYNIKSKIGYHIKLSVGGISKIKKEKEKIIESYKQLTADEKRKAFLNK